MSCSQLHVMFDFFPANEIFVYLRATQLTRYSIIDVIISLLTVSKVRLQFFTKLTKTMIQSNHDFIKKLIGLRSVQSSSHFWIENRTNQLLVVYKSKMSIRSTKTLSNNSSSCQTVFRFYFARVQFNFSQQTILTLLGALCSYRVFFRAECSLQCVTYGLGSTISRLYKLVTFIFSFVHVSEKSGNYDN